MIDSLGQGQPEVVRKLAAHGDAAVPALVAELKREGRTYRFQHDAALVLAAIGTAPATEALLQLAQGALGQTNSSLREWAARQFAAALKDKRQAAQLLTCPEPGVQSVALEALTGQSLDETALIRVAELAVGKSFPAVWRAMATLAACPDEGTLPRRLDAIALAIISAEKSPQAQELVTTLPGVTQTNLQETWLTAVRVMSEMKASSKIMADFARRAEANAGACAWVAMGFRHDPAALEPLCQVVKNDRIQGLRELAIYALAEVAGEAQLPLLRQLAGADEQPPVGQRDDGTRTVKVDPVRQAAREGLRKLEARLQGNLP